MRKSLLPKAPRRNRRKSRQKNLPRGRRLLESESQSAKEETKQEEPASSSEQAADTEEAAASQEKTSTQPEEEKTNWVTYTETKTSFMGSNCILHVKYGIGEKNITVQETEDAEDDRVESKRFIICLCRFSLPSGLKRAMMDM